MLSIPPDVQNKHADLIAAIDRLADRHGRQRSALMPILQDLRRDCIPLSDLAMQLIGDRLGLSPVEVEGVATFYSFLGTGTPAKHAVHMCRTLSCDMAGGRAVAKQVSETLGIPMGSVTADGQVSLEWANCIGLCDQAPAMLIDHEAHAELTPDSAAEIVTRVTAE